MRTGPVLQAAHGDPERFNVRCYLEVQVWNAKCEALLIFNKYVEIKIKSAFWSNCVRLIDMQEIRAVPADWAGPRCCCKHCKMNFRTGGYLKFCSLKFILSLRVGCALFFHGDTLCRCPFAMALGARCRGAVVAQVPGCSRRDTQPWRHLAALTPPPWEPRQSLNKNLNWQIKTN